MADKPASSLSDSLPRPSHLMSRISIIITHAFWAGLASWRSQNSPVGCSNVSPGAGVSRGAGAHAPRAICAADGLKLRECEKIQKRDCDASKCCGWRQSDTAPLGPSFRNCNEHERVAANKYMHMK